MVTMDKIFGASSQSISYIIVSETSQGADEILIWIHNNLDFLYIQIQIAFLENFSDICMKLFLNVVTLTIPIPAKTVFLLTLLGDENGYMDQ